MGPKIAIIHADKVADPRALAVILDELGVDLVRVSLRRPATDTHHVAAIVAVIPPDDDTATIRFVGGSLASVDLAALVATAPGSISLHTADASLHVWPTRATVIRRESPDLAAVATILGEDELRPGATTIHGVTTVTIDPAADGSIGHVNAFDLGTSDLGVALDVFAAIASHDLDRGWLTRPSHATLGVLPAFVTAIGGDLELDVVLASHDATDLALEVMGDMRFDTPVVNVRLPDGELSTRIAADDETAWRLRIGDAVSVSKFQPSASAGEIE